MEQSHNLIIDDVFDEITSFQWLYDSHLNARKLKRYRDDVLLFSDHLERNLLDLQEDLRAGTYRLGPYRKFYVYEPAQRMIMALQYRDRIVQWAVYKLLYPAFDRMMIYDSYACRQGKGTHAAADRLQYWLRRLYHQGGQTYYLKTDISKYFYRVDHEILTGILSRYIRDEKLLRLLDLIINSETTKFGLPAGFAPWNCPEEMWLYDVGIPIGNLTSQLFANIYLNELDQFVKHGLRAHYYLRYMDDSTILSKSKSALHEYRETIGEFISANLRLDLNNKTVVRPVTEGLPFCGYRIWGTYRTLKKGTARRIIRNTARLCRGLARGTVSPCEYNRVIASYKGILDHCDSGGLRETLYRLQNSQWR